MLMKRVWIIASVAIALIFGLSLAAHAQEQEPRYTINAGGGYSPLLGQIHNRLSNGWHITAGAGFRAKSHFEITGQYSYNGFGVQSVVLGEAGVPAANSHLWSITADPKLRFRGGHHLDPYLVGGVGYYRRTVNFTAPTVAAVTLYDPFFGFLFPALEPANVLLGSISRSGIGGNGGFGFDFRLGQSRGKLFVEARYEYAATGNLPTRMIPVTLGVSW
jgi:opacity protein-like surface antigen